MKLIWIYSLLFIFISCKKVDKEQIVNTSNPNLRLKNGVLYLKTLPFSGNLVAYYPNGNKQSDIQYLKGRKHGYEKQWFLNNELSIKRFYTNGIKTGIHKGWWNKKQLKFEYYFNTNGKYHGTNKEWFETGQLYRYFNYINGEENGSQHLWKKNGAIKANYEVVNGERFGLIGLKKCKTVRLNSTTLE